MIKKLTPKLRHDERGITGLETAIILIAFVVIASVFAYTVLSAGIFSSQKGEEAIYAGLEQTRSTLELKGAVIAQTGGGNSVSTIEFVVTNALDGEPIDLTAPTDADADGIADSSSTNVTTIKYSSENQSVDDIDWTQTEIGKGDGDTQLEPGEQFKVVVDLGGVGETISTYHEFTVEMKPPTGTSLRINRTTPPNIDPVMILD